jgi:glycosyltransferase involved in cell wall biosynthesis
MPNKHLLLLTAEYPYGKGETFLENEVPILAQHFDKITIISLSENSEQTREIQSICEVFRFPVSLSKTEKILALRYLLLREVRAELKRVTSVYKLKVNFQIISTILVSWARAKKIKSLFRKHLNSESIAYSYWTDDSSLALAQLKIENPDFKCVSRFHGWDVYFEASAIGYLPFRKFINDHLDQQYAISDAGSNYARTRWGIDFPNKISVSRLGTATQMEHWLTRESMREQRLIVSCSNVIPLKRVELIFAVLNGLVNDEIRWVHFGDGQNLAELERKIAHEKKSHLTVELRGRVSNEEVLEFYKQESPDFFINLSTSEGIPVSIMEAFSVGIPVIATPVGGVPEIVSNQAGALVDPHATAEEIQMILINLLSKPLSDWNLLSEQAYEVWKNQYNAETNFTSFAHALKKI